MPPRWGPSPRLGWRYYAPLPPRRRPELSGVTVLVLVTVLAVLAAPHAREVRGLVTAGVPGPFKLPKLPTVRLPGSASPAPAARAPSPRAARAVAFAKAQRGKPYRWGAEGPSAYDCSGLTWAAWQYAGVAIPRTAAGQLAGLPQAWGRPRPGDLVIYRSSGPTRRHVAIVAGRGLMVEAPASGVPVRVTRLRSGWLGAVRPGGDR